MKVVAHITANALDNAFFYENLESIRLQLIQFEILRAMGELATGVTHNFNNLLSGILGHTQMFKDGNYNIVITDVGLSDISGWAVSKKAKGILPHGPLVFMTG